MVYLDEFCLPSLRAEESYLNSFRRTCFDSYYPFRFFSYDKQLTKVEFDDITIFCGGNGSGKSTLLNIIAEKLHLKRETPYNKTYFFDPYIELCNSNWDDLGETQKYDLSKASRIVTSDDVFRHILDVRRRNEDLDFKRNLVFEQNDDALERPRSIHFDDPKSVQNYIDYYNRQRLSDSQYTRRFLGVDERTYSNGENGFKYFTDVIQPGGLYLLDEPENSLSAELQLQLGQFLLNMTRFYKCQFVMSSHSPFLLSIPFAKIYNIDNEPVSTCKWTELPNVRIYYVFFKQHESEFDV